MWNLARFLLGQSWRYFNRSELDAKSMENEDFLFVVAIDFGTTYSGYSFSSRDDYRSNPLSQHSKQWYDSFSPFVSSKTSTCILFDPKGEFQNFGFDAEEKFYNLAEDGNHKDWYYFRRFKMWLYEQNDHGLHNKKLMDQNGKEMDAIKVFSQSILYLKNSFFEQTRNTGLDWGPNDIRWVLTVPAIWTEAKKSFMRKAAEMAGIAHHQLLIALEPEAAAIFSYNFMKTNCAEDFFQPSRRFIVVDAGGGTVDVTVYEVADEGDLRELLPPSGGDWGGNKVNEEFISLLEEICGKDIMVKFRQEFASEYHELEMDIESSKCRMKASQDDKEFTLKLPGTLRDMIREKVGKGWHTTINRHGKTFEIKLKTDKIRFSQELALFLFKQPVSSIVNHLNVLLSRPCGHNIDAVILVGGFANSSVLFNTVKNKFSTKKVIAPNYQDGDASWSILRGAVNYGHGSKIIGYRRSKRTIGFEVNEPYDISRHHDRQKVTINGKERCYNVFKKMVEKNQLMKAGEFKTEQVGVDPDWDGNLIFFASDKENPIFTNEESCFKIGSMRMEGSFPPNSVLEINMIFSKTEIEFNIKNIQSGHVSKRYLTLE